MPRVKSHLFLIRRLLFKAWPRPSLGSFTSLQPKITCHHVKGYLKPAGRHVFSIMGINTRMVRLAKAVCKRFDIDLARVPTTNAASFIMFKKTGFLISN